MAKSPPPAARKLRQETVTRRAAKAETERELLLTSATAVFGNRGYHEASMREIATQSGFSIGALYQRFESKDELYCEVVQNHFAAIWDVVDRILEQNLPFGPRMLALTMAIFEHYTVHRSFLRLYGIHPPTVAEPYQSRISLMQSQERARLALVDAFRQGQLEGLIAVADVDFLGSMYVGMINRAVTEYLLNRRPLPDPAGLVALFVNGVGAPRKSAGRPPSRGIKRLATARPRGDGGQEPPRKPQAQALARGGENGGRRA